MHNNGNDTDSCLSFSVVTCQFTGTKIGKAIILPNWKIGEPAEGKDPTHIASLPGRERGCVQTITTIQQFSNSAIQQFNNYPHYVPAGTGVLFFKKK